MLARIKGKINKIGPSTYEATKVFMQQILSGDETEFLDECMKFIFQKAATESAFCSLYAKLLHELADEFSHLRTVMVELFRDYMAIFTEVESSPDVGTSDYKAFLEAQERKKFRRGYSQFVGELVKLGEAEEKDFSRLVQQIVSVIESNYANVSQTLLCEEYIDCLANLCNCASAILVGKEWSHSVKLRLEDLVKKPRTETPGLTNKGRFALMDLADSSNSW
jgi:transcriptional regulator of heat shock response